MPNVLHAEVTELRARLRRIQGERYWLSDALAQVDSWLTNEWDHRSNKGANLKEALRELDAAYKAFVAEVSK